MKYILLLSLFLCSCQPTDDQEDQYIKKETKISTFRNANGVYQYSVVEMDGCEYIWVNAGYGSWGAHKGNCKNPIHIYQKTISADSNQRPER